MGPAPAPDDDGIQTLPAADQFARLLHPPRRHRHPDPRPARRHHRRLHELLPRLLRRRTGAGRHPRERGHLRLRRRGQARRQLHADDGRLGGEPLRHGRADPGDDLARACPSRRSGSWSSTSSASACSASASACSTRRSSSTGCSSSFPSGFAVANILRALTDIRILKTSIAKLGGGTLAGFAGGLARQPRSRRSPRTGFSRLDPRRRHDRRRRASASRPSFVGAIGALADAVAAGERLARRRTIRSARSASSSRSA